MRAVLRCRIIAALLVAIVASLAVANASHAAYPGRNGKIVFWTPSGGCCDLIWTMNPDGSDLRAIYGAPSQYAEFPEVSPDGTKIVVAGMESIDVLDFSGTGLFSFVDPVCAAATCLFPWVAPGPVWSPDSSHLAWFSTDTGLWIGSSASEALIDASLTISPDSVRWSPDGTKVSFVDAGVSYIINADGSGLHRDVSSFPPDLGRTPLSPDGTKRIYSAPVASTAPSTQVFVSNLNGSNPRQLTNLTADCPFATTDPFDCATNPDFQPPRPFNPGFLVWQPVPPISCRVAATGTNSSGQNYIEITVQDARLGVKTVAVGRSTNATVAMPSFSVGSTDPLVFRVTQLDRSTEASVALKIRDLYGNLSSCEQRIPAQP